LGAAWRAALPWSRLVVLGLLVTGGLVVGRLATEPHWLVYAHLLVDYRFGFVRRGLMGELLSHILARTAPWHAYALGLAAWSVAVGLYAAVFRRLRFPDARQAAIFLCFTALSPVFLKNFVQTLGYFDVYGAMLLMAAILAPPGLAARSAVAAGCAVLLAVHHIHALLYVPAVLVVLTWKALAAGEAPARALAGGALLAAALAAVFAAIVLQAAPVAPERLVAAMRERAAVPIPDYMHIPWTQTLAHEVQATAWVFANNAPRLPIYVALALLHLPLGRWVAAFLRTLPQERRRLVAAGFALVTLAYLPVFVVAFDYARWVASWGSCMILLAHAAVLAFGRDAAALPRFDETSRWTLVCALALVLIPRLGTEIPF
jgi:hypothetical protein